jgi:hypothetical protein
VLQSLEWKTLRHQSNSQFQAHWNDKLSLTVMMRMRELPGKYLNGPESLFEK